MLLRLEKDSKKYLSIFLNFSKNRMKNNLLSMIKRLEIGHHGKMGMFLYGIFFSLCFSLKKEDTKVVKEA